MRKLLLVLSTVGLMLGAVVTPASASHSWNGYHWARTSNPFTIKLGDNVSASWDSYLGTAASDWSADTANNPLNASVVAGGTTSRKCRATTGRVEVCSDTYGRNGWLGLASVSVSSGGHITKGTAKMNDTYYNTAMYDTPAWRGSVMCQEVGHTFGLDHQDTSGADLHTCMDYATNPDTDNMHPNYHDYQELATIYSHLDSSTTIGAVPAGSRTSRIVRSDRRTHSTIVRYHANGSMRIVYIIWANG